LTRQDGLFDPARLGPPLLVEFLHPDSNPIDLLDLGFEFLEREKVPQTRWERPFRLELFAVYSRAGNPLYDYSLSKVPLPDGLDTRLRIEGSEVEFGEEHASDAGNPTRSAKTTIYVEGVKFNVVCYLTKTEHPYYVKVTAMQAGGKRRRSLAGRIA